MKGCWSWRGTTDTISKRKFKRSNNQQLNRGNRRGPLATGSRPAPPPSPPRLRTAARVLTRLPHFSLSLSLFPFPSPFPLAGHSKIPRKKSQVPVYRWRGMVYLPRRSAQPPECPATVAQEERPTMAGHGGRVRHTSRFAPGSSEARSVRRRVNSPGLDRESVGRLVSGLLTPDAHPVSALNRCGCGSGDFPAEQSSPEHSLRLPAEGFRAR